MLVETSKDVLFIVIAFCVLWVTVFLCWMFFYVMKILKNTNSIIEEFRLKLQSLTEAINYIRGKVEHMSGLMTMATSGVSGLVKRVASKKAKEWASAGAEKFKTEAKNAVQKAVKATAKRTSKTAKKVKNKK